jgi:hypothetical protein
MDRWTAPTTRTGDSVICWVCQQDNYHSEFLIPRRRVRNPARRARARRLFFRRDAHRAPVAVRWTIRAGGCRARRSASGATGRVVRSVGRSSLSPCSSRFFTARSTVKTKGPSPFFEVMALWVELDLLVGWLHHPVRVGRLMPTLVRTRVRARPRNMFCRLCHRTTGLGVGGRD